ncbi:MULTISPECIES: hypothetical protein [unclassified Sphingomonas]|uniref:hypothetical protein n=1 Tax=unclassified Sphingomonas TaxID=196159 RepID=UPI0006FC9DE6|nr:MULTISPECIES: hypothetical protein [unclassified Sphingomonas]KQM62396.1 hypothetical protein ASE65_05265 [Sphingomonas sp. Leaf16]KQN13799.1 hypothetical protein ASE81_05335 [Sphingomonas sp. Leaf29]KQN22972.1 hypothetical protein ASE83_00075 [Sphingomonas sp. Leaf32]
MTREETAPGQVLCFGSDEDSGCDVGTSIGLGDGKALWIGELLTADGANMGFVFHGPDRQRIVAPFADGTDWQEIAELFRRHVAPAIATIADAEAAAMRERVEKEADILAAGMEAEAGKETDPVMSSLHACSASTMRRFSAFVRALPATGEVGRG